MSVRQILMKRDGMTSQEADDAIKECRDALLECEPFEADSIIEDYLGLEPDYLMEVLCF